MPSFIALYRLQDFIRLTETGEIDPERSKEIIHELAAAAGFHRAHNILIDFRGATEHLTIGDNMELALEVGHYRSAFSGKMAFLFPNDPERLARAKEFLACLDTVGYRFQTAVFTSFEDAINWLANKDGVKPSSRT